MEAKRVAIYARVSTTEQDPQNQMPEMKSYIARRGWTAAGEYVDHGVSGAKESRPGLDALMADARSGKVDVLLVWALDRLGRSLQHLLKLASELEAIGVDLAVVTQSIDTTTPTGRLTFAVLGAVAEFERAMFRSRIKAGIAKRRGKGLPVGRQRKASTEQAAKIVELRREGRSWRKIAMAVGLKVSTVRATHAEVCRKPLQKGPLGTVRGVASQGVASEVCA